MKSRQQNDEKWEGRTKANFTFVNFVALTASWNLYCLKCSAVFVFRARYGNANNSLICVLWVEFSQNEINRKVESSTKTSYLSEKSLFWLCAFYDTTTLLGNSEWSSLSGRMKFRRRRHNKTTSSFLFIFSIWAPTRELCLLTMRSFAAIQTSFSVRRCCQHSRRPLRRIDRLSAASRENFQRSTLKLMLQRHLKIK